MCDASDFTVTAEEAAKHECCLRILAMMVNVYASDECVDTQRHTVSVKTLVRCILLATTASKRMRNSSLVGFSAVCVLGESS